MKITGLICHKSKIIKSYLILLLGLFLFVGLLGSTNLQTETIFLVSTISMFFLSILFFSKNFFNPFCFFFVYSFLGFIDITMVAAGVRTSLIEVPEYIYNKALLIMLLWFITFSIGYGLMVILFTKIKEFNYPKIVQETKINPWLIYIMCATLFVYSLLSSFKNSIKLGGLVQGMGGGAAFADQGYLLTLLGFAGCLPVMALYRGKKVRAIMYALIVFLGIVITGRRSMAIISAILPISVYWNAKVKSVKLSKIAIIAVPLIIIILYIGAIRTTENPNFTITNTNNPVLSQLTILARYNGYGDNIPAMIYKLENGELSNQGFRYTLRGIEFFVPRSLWPDKPIVHSAQIISSSVFLDGDVGRPVNAYGWGYFTFGYLGVIFSGLTTGIIVSYFYRIVQKKKSVILLCIYSLLILPLLEMYQPEAQMKILLFAVTLKVLEILSRKVKVRGKALGGEYLK